MFVLIQDPRLSLTDPVTEVMMRRMMKEFIHVAVVL